MGILDDAIREHLDLIRSRGATDSEVQRLEDEAFGPPTRPDEADFPESEEATAASANGVATEAPEEHEFEDLAAHEDATTLMPSAEAGEEPAEAGEAGTGLEEPTGAHIAADHESEEMLVDHVEEPAAEVEHEEPIAEEHQIVEEPAPDVREDNSEEGPVAAEEGTSLYDQSDDALDADLNLQLDDDAAPPEEHPLAEPEGTTPLEPPIESLDTVEHAFHEEIVEEEPVDEGEQAHDEAAPSDEYAVEEPPAPEHEEGQLEGDDEEEGDDDVLADTPEFLKDAPEDDELWFEQGEPKDFDF
jgi:hypothetical protein